MFVFVVNVICFVCLFVVVSLSFSCQFKKINNKTDSIIFTRKYEGKLKMELTNEANEQLLESLVQKERQERLVMATATSETLSKLNISLENLPQNCQQLLNDVCLAQAASGMDQLDPVAITIRQTREAAEKLNDEYVILKLKQKNKELQSRIDHNATIISQLKQDLAQSRQSLSSQDPNPDTVQEYCRLMKQKVGSYEENCQRALAKFSSLAVPEYVMPKHLFSLGTSLAQLSVEAKSMRRSAEEIELVNQARNALLMLKK